MNVLGKKYKTDKPKEPPKIMNRKRWLELHPEDQWLDDENQRARKTGYANDDVRQLMAAICLRACVDYKRATLGEKLEGETVEETLERCHEFFSDPDDIFQLFVNRMPVADIEKAIRATPKGSIHAIWKQNEYSQVPAIFTTPIIEE